MPIRPRVQECESCGYRFHTYDMAKVYCNDECGLYGPKSSTGKRLPKSVQATVKKCFFCREPFEAGHGNDMFCHRPECDVARAEKAKGTYKPKANPMPKWAQNTRIQQARLNVMAHKLTHSTPNKQY